MEGARSGGSWEWRDLGVEGARNGGRELEVEGARIGESYEWREAWRELGVEGRRSGGK